MSRATSGVLVIIRISRRVHKYVLFTVALTIRSHPVSMRTAPIAQHFGTDPQRIEAIDHRLPPRRRRKISFSQGVEWKALISTYIGTMPLSGHAPCPEHSESMAPPPIATV